MKRTTMGERIFRAAMGLLPGSLRDAWGEELLDTFRRRQAEARHRWGPLGLPPLWLKELAGLLRTALRARFPDAWTRATAPAPPRPHTPHSTSKGNFMDQLLSDIHFAFRTFGRRPGMMVLAVLSLALGVGASTAMFSVVDTVLLRPLPFEDPDELVTVYASNPDLRGHPTFAEFAVRGTVSLPEFWWVSENQQSFEHIGAYFGYDGPVLSGDGRPQRLARVLASSGLLPALGVSPVAGRLFGEQDDPRDGVRSVMLTESFWRSQFGGDPSVVGTTVRLDGDPHEIIGVLPDRVEEATQEADIWEYMTGSSDQGNWGNHSLTGVIGRLADGVSVAQATDDVARVFQRAPEETQHDHGAAIFPALEDQTRNVRNALLALIGGAVVLLVVGCGNVATILIGAGIDRSREIAVRSAVGAGRGRLMRQLLTESVVLAGIGAVGGILLAVGVSQGLLHLAPPGVPRIEDAALDGRVLSFALGISVVSGILFGMVPALSLSRPDLAAAMGTRRGNSEKSRLQGALVVVELALATVLLVSSALLGRTLFALNNLDLGLDPEGLHAVRLAPPYYRFDQEDPEERQAALSGYFQELMDAVGSAPGVTSVALTRNVPLTGDRSNNTVNPEGWDAEAEGEQLISERRFVSEGYFETTGIPIVEGRSFDRGDNRPDAAPVMIISRGLARRVWPEEPAVGKQVSFWGRDPATVVGVAGNLRDEALDRETEYAFYVPIQQVTSQTGSLVVRLTGDGETVVPTLRQRLWEVDPDLAITRIVSFDELVDEAVSEQRYRARLMVAFGVLAGLLALMGIYGVVNRSVARRNREIGIRVALGAYRSDVLAMILKQGTRLAVVGVVLGLGIASFATRFLEDLLFGVRPMDPVSLVGIALLVGVASVAASLPPGRRATRVDPMVALRTE